MQCHGADARGAKGFPNLTDNDWLYGGSAEKICETLVNGRIGQMPAFGAAFGEEKVRDTANYVLSLSGKKHDAERATRGKEAFNAVCAACHGPDGKGNQAIGAPNLTLATYGCMAALRKSSWKVSPTVVRTRCQLGMSS